MTTKLPLFCIAGTVGIPAKYGGFETLVENLAVFHGENELACDLRVFCSARSYPDKPDTFGSTQLDYLPLDANGAQSVLYDGLSLWRSMRRKADTILLLGVSGAIFLPFLRAVSSIRIITNIDGIEWKRKKWKAFAKLILRASEWAAVHFSHEVIADNQAIADYVQDTYGIGCHVIAYGGDHALRAPGAAEAAGGLPDRYALGLCRIEPENNVHVILEALEGLGMPLVFVGNWDSSAYGRDLKAQYCESPNLYLLDPIYDPGALHVVRARASVYLHGHSAGGTNPSLVEMMHFGVPVLAHGCSFNRHTTEGKARYFESAAELAEQLRNLDTEDADRIGADMLEIAQRKYTWDQIGKAYFELLYRAQTEAGSRKVYKFKIR